MRPDASQGQRIGRYEIKAMLGRGGMATVYRAHDTALRRDVALKVLYPQFGGDDTLIERFQHEAILAASLDHPNIVPIYDVGEADGVVYIAMKLLDGRSLADLLRVQPTLAPATLVPIIDQIAAALDYAHRRGIVHRDIKTANIMLEGPDAGPFHAMLTDFGIAKSLDSSGMTTTGVLIGTPDYMAPEQISQKPVDGRADIYALGVVAFRCLTGRRPFEGGTEQVLVGHLQGAVPDASQLEPSLPPVVNPVIRKALAKRPENRYASAGEFARVLRAALGFETLTPPPAQSNAVDPRAVVPGVAAERIARAHAADAPTQISATNAPTQRAPTNVPTQRAPTSAPTQRGPVPVAPPRPNTSQPPRRNASTTSNIGPMIAIALLIVALGGLTFALYRTFAATNNGGNNGGNSPILPLPTAQVLATNPPEPTNVVPPTDVPPQPTPLPEASVAPTSAELPPTAAPTSAELPPTATPSAEVQPTVAPPTAIPIPPTAIPPTAIPPTAVPPTEIPPMPVPPTAAPIACVIEPTRGFGALVKANPNVSERIGCPKQNEVASSVAEQAFQRGAMLWYNAQNGEMFYVLKNNSTTDGKGTWTTFTKDQVDAVKNRTPPTIETPPDTLYIPREGSGFYYIWTYNENVRRDLGYAFKTAEDTFDGAAFQTYDGGTMLFTPNSFGQGATIYVLYNDHTFERYRDTSATAPN